jgi:pSer/pThr/pTyr-binding forkhead associated (FHA) protein
MVNPTDLSAGFRVPNMADPGHAPMQFPVVPGTAPQVRLTVMRGPGEGSTIALRRTVSLLGSRDGCKVLLRHAEVSPVHCAIVNTGFDVILRDLVSKTGTFLNDLRAECERLDDGDVVKVAAWEFLVDVRSPLTATGTPVPTVDFEPTRTVALQAVGNGQLVKLRRDVNVIGRRPGCDVLLQQPQVSRAHALIASFQGQPTVFDLFSGNSLTVNGQEVSFAPIKSGDLLEIGPAALRVVMPEGGVRAVPKADTSVSAATAVIQPESDTEDKIDIRAAELNPRHAR